MKYYLFFVLIALVSCKNSDGIDKNNSGSISELNVDTVYISKNCDSLQNQEYFISERIPFWIHETQIIKDYLIIGSKYKVENRMNPLYLEDDFNGDDYLDIVLPIYEISTNKKGFAIIHGETNQVFIIGAGKLVKNGLSDDQNYIGIWFINRSNLNEPGLEEETGNDSEGNLVLKNHSIKIEASEIGGGLIYWNGKEYAYFHQTC